MTWLRASRSTVIAACALAVPGGRARADGLARDPYALPDAPRPPSLPELTHPDIEWTNTLVVGAVGHGGVQSPELVERLAVEVPVGFRRYFVGLAYEAADGPPIARPAGSSFVGGNVELYGRTVWATRTGLAFGAGLGVLPPIAAFTPDSPGGGGDVALAAASLVPWDYAYFRAGVLTVRPFVDVRDLVGPFVIQFRQSFDWSAQTHDFTNTEISAASTFYFGGLVSHLVGLGLETTEYYQITASIPDDRRSKLIFTPAVRFFTPGIQPALGVFVGAGSMLAPVADSVWGFRFSLTFVWDPRKPFFRALEIL